MILKGVASMDRYKPQQIQHGANHAHVICDVWYLH